MCPRRQHLQILPAAFRDDFDLAALDIAHPSDKREILRLVISRESKADSLHPSADYQMQPRVTRLLLSRHESRASKSSTFARKNRPEPLLVEHPNSQITCLLQLRTRLRARDHEVRLAADRRRDSSPCRHDFALGVDRKSN